MSKLGGVYHFDLRPVSPEERTGFQMALKSGEYRSPLEHRERGLMLGWAAGAEPQRGRGLIEAPNGSWCAWDGRLDNRQDLLPVTGLPAGSPDSAVVLGIYMAKGIAGLGDVVGDWSLAIWDAPRRTVLLSSDYAGIRPLYYYRNAGSLYWSSSLGDLVRRTGVTELDELYAGSFLAHGSAPGRTPYAGVCAVPPGFAVSISADKIVERAFWDLPVHREIRYADEREYEERLLELWRESVGARIAGDKPVCAELSGGLDSSSVVAMADRLRKESPGAGPELHTFSYTHENCPDEKFFREVERACNLTGFHLELQQYPAASADGAGAAPAWWQPRFRELARRVAELKAGVFLTGQLGDCIMGNTHDDTGQVAESIARKQFRQGAREAYAWAKTMQAPIYPILWRGMREAYTSWVPSASPHDSVGAIRPSADDSIMDSLRTRVESYDRERFADGAWHHAPPGRRRRFRAVGEMLRTRHLQTPEALQQIWYAHPFAHRPLVEFMLTVPAGVVCGPNQPRRLMRRAFAGLLPPMVLTRKSKAEYTDMYVGALMPLARTMVKNPGGIQIVERGYVERSSLITRLEKFTQGVECNEAQLRQVILFEFWLRSQVAAAPLPQLAIS